MKKWKIVPFIIVFLLLCTAVLFGSILGAGLAGTRNIQNTENFREFDIALPTKLLDINGELITEFTGAEKRELIALEDLPQLMKDALITREDRVFYEHRGFRLKAILRAFYGQLKKLNYGGGSTLTQQIAGTLYTKRTDYTVKRKILELWWALQMERRYSKNEILELYLNRIYFGAGTYGVNTASKYYFGHGATEITPAEAAILVVQLSSPTNYNPFEHPNVARSRQSDVLKAMVEEGYLTQEEASESFDDYWANFDYTRTSTTAYYMSDDKAPWFSEYVRRTLSDMVYGADDIYAGGFTVNTTLNLSHQQAADEVMKDYIAYANKSYQDTMNKRRGNDFRTYIPMTSLLSLMFNLPSLRVGDQRNEIQAVKSYTDNINPVLDVMSVMLGMDSLKTEFVNRGNALQQQNKERTTIEGTMIAIENETGYIDAIVGGSKYDQANQFIRAVQSRVQPGATFKPLYYSAAIDSQNFTMTSIISDTPTVFRNADGTPYIPQDFKGQWEGDVQLWYALAHSMNIPSIKVLDAIGFDAAIKRTSALLGIAQSELQERSFEPVYPFGLGTASVRPIEMAKAFATFANNGKEVTPIAIRNVEDRNGTIILNPEKELRAAQKAKGDNIQIISPQTAFIMQEMLKKTVQSGTLRYGTDFDSTAWTIGKRKGKGNKLNFTTKSGSTFTMPAAGKTGTAQNWSNAWTVGFTPYYTAAFWFGFDKPGQSLGLATTGSTLAGVAWGDYMHDVHVDKPYKTFVNAIPEGVVEMQVCSVSGELLTPECGKHQITAYYLKGTEPRQTCTRHTYTTGKNIAIERLRRERFQSGYSYNIDSSPLVLQLDFLTSTRQVIETSYEETEEEDFALDGMEENLQNNEDEDDFSNLLLE